MLLLIAAECTENKRDLEPCQIDRSAKVKLKIERTRPVAIIIRRIRENVRGRAGGEGGGSRISSVSRVLGTVPRGGFALVAT